MTSQRCCLFVLALLGCQAGDTSKQAEVRALPSVTTLPAPILTASQTPVILIYGESYTRVVPADQGQVDVAVWHNGHTVWRVNDSLLEGHIETANIEPLLQRLHREGVFGSSNTRFDSFGPDSSFDVIEIRLADRELQLRSWHDGFEENEKLVVTSHGTC